MHVIHCTELVERPIDQVLQRLPHDLLARPQRPGHLCEAVPLATSHVTAPAVAAAHTARIPIELYIVLAVEATHAIHVAALAVEVTQATLRTHLEELLRSRRVSDVTTQFARPLQEYAVALEQGVESSPLPQARFVTLTLTQEQAATWTRAAVSDREPLDHWVERRLERPVAQVQLMEANAARNGQTLTEWILLEAARFASAPRGSRRSGAREG